MMFAVKDILEARSVTQTPAMAPACGLYLADVKYEFGDS
jgi:tRNA U38,U39,U40 pseudouridine synthase TruA